MDPNTAEANFALSRLNTQGFRINVGFNITDWLKFETFYYGAWNLDKNIHNLNGTQASNGTIRNFYDGNAIQNLFIQLTLQLLTSETLPDGDGIGEPSLSPRGAVFPACRSLAARHVARAGKHEQYDNLRSGV